jgi:hypothetical protein
MRWLRTRFVPTRSSPTYAGFFSRSSLSQSPIIFAISYKWGDKNTAEGLMKLRRKANRNYGWIWFIRDVRVVKNKKDY